MNPIPWAKPEMWGDEEALVVEALRSGWISGGSFVERLEDEVAGWCKSPYGVSACNGTASLHMAYLAIGLQPGDEVVVPGFCFLAAANVALHMGARPVFADVDPATWCSNAAHIERCLTPRTKVIVPVHTYGGMADMAPIMDLAKSRSIFVLEDAAESFGCRYRGQYAGAIGDAGSLSFQATKTITTGEGGMVLTARPELRDAMRLYRSHGMLRKRYFHEVVGHNFRLTNLQAAFGCAQFKHIDEIVRQRKRVHADYLAHLSGTPGVMPQQFLPDVDPVLWAMAVQLDERAYPQGRDAVMAEMTERGIETRPGFYSPRELPIYAAVAPIPGAERLSRQVISLPTFPTLSTEQIAYICQSLKSIKR